MAQVPGSTPVAFRMPCCDSLNTPSPRFFAEIFNKATPGGRFLTIDTSVFNITTPNDPELPRELVVDPDGRERFRKYVPFESFVNTIQDYPYPYVIGKLCWQFPCATPSDWQAQNLHKPDNPRTVEDWKALLDVTVIKRGVMNLVFHPHNWIKSEQVAELVDYAATKHGKKVKFLTFRECQERLDKHLLAGNPLRDAKGDDNGVRLLDANNDGYMDVVVGNEKALLTRVWEPKSQRWVESGFPDGAAAMRFGVVHDDGMACAVLDSVRAWKFDGRAWAGDTPALHDIGGSYKPAFGKGDAGVRLRDLDGDGRCEVIAVADGRISSRAGGTLPFRLPDGAALRDPEGRDNGVRFVDVNADGRDDVVFSNDESYGVYLFTDMKQGWSQKVLAGKRGDGDALPQIVRDGTNNGAWFHSNHLWVQNENTAGMPNLVDRRSFAQLTGSKPKNDPATAARSPEASLASLKVRPGFVVEQVACEPLVRDPVNFDWGPDGTLWVVEMGDYPLGTDGKGKKGGEVRRLTDTDGDGKYDKATVFLDGLGYPDGVIAWRNGILVTAAPDIIYAEDTDGDGVADKREVVFTGFATGNPQHLVNGFVRGLDNWLYGANGHAGGSVKSTKTGETVVLGGRDWRVRPDEGILDPQAGISQFGRPRDDWGNWFGCDNSVAIWHFVLDDYYTRRNPHVAPPDSRRDLVPGQMQIYPVSTTVERFNDFGHVNRVTSSNSVHVYRDELLGPEFVDNWFVSEPVHNLVHREALTADGVTFKSSRVPGEEKSEFLASTDNWFRPTAIKTGPDGALYVADMYRQVIEHPEWIPMDWQRRVDLRAGADKGRIYRVYPVGKKPRAVPRLDKLDAAALVAALDSPSGWQRDMAQELLVQKKDRAAVAPLEALAGSAQRPQARLHALCALDGLGALSPALAQKALADAHPGVRRHAVRLSERHLNDAPAVADAVVKLADDADAQVRMQVAYGLGAWDSAAAGEPLGRIAVNAGDDHYLRAAALSSATSKNLPGMVAAVTQAGDKGAATGLLGTLLRVAQKTGNAEATASMLKAVGAPAENGAYRDWQFAALGALLDSLDERGASIAEVGGGTELGAIFDAARKIAADRAAPAARRGAAISILGRGPSGNAEDARFLASLLNPAVPDDVQSAAVRELGRLKDKSVVTVLVGQWKGYGPELRARVMDVLLSRAEGVAAVLEAVGGRKVLPNEIDAERRQRLLQHADAGVRERAAKLLAEVVNPDRQKVMEAYAASVSLDGDASRGRESFTRLCATCHKLGAVGNAVGPDLVALTDRSPEFLLLSIVDPNRAVEAKYTNYVLETKAGETLSGVLAAETGNSVTLLGADGKSHVVLRTDLKSMRSSGLSLMPEGLETGLRPQDMADLMAFVRAAAPQQPRKQFPGNKPQLVRPGTDGSLRLLPTDGEIYGSTIVLEERYGNLGYWSSPDDRVVWVVEPARPGRYNVWLEFACDDSVANNRFFLQTGDQSNLESIPGTGGWDNYKRQQFGVIDLRLGRQRITIRTEGPVAGALMDLKSIELVPVR
jgi:putative membrane-bound dehydrogenase-like protein